MSKGNPAYGAHGLEIAGSHITSDVTLPTPPNANAHTFGDLPPVTLPTASQADGHVGHGIDVAGGHVPDHVTLPDFSSLTKLDFFPHG